MLRESEKQTLRKKLTEYEGNVPHMYLDTGGNVTVGVGRLLNTMVAAQKLPFIDDKTKKKATPEEIKADFEAVLKFPQDNYKPKTAAFYKAHTKLVLTKPEIDALTESHIDDFHRELKRRYSSFGDYPTEARLALFDMIFNLGMTNLRRKFPNFDQAIKDQDWKKAADESKRKLPVNASRNSYVKELLNKAAENTNKNKKPYFGALIQLL